MRDLDRATFISARVGGRCALSALVWRPEGWSSWRSRAARCLAKEVTNRDQAASRHDSIALMSCSVSFSVPTVMRTYGAVRGPSK